VILCSTGSQCSSFSTGFTALNATAHRQMLSVPTISAALSTRSRKIFS